MVDCKKFCLSVMKGHCSFCRIALAYFTSPCISVQAFGKKFKIVYLLLDN